MMKASCHSSAKLITLRERGRKREDFEILMVHSTSLLIVHNVVDCTMKIYSSECTVGKATTITRDSHIRSQHCPCNKEGHWYSTLLSRLSSEGTVVASEQIYDIMRKMSDSQSS